MSNIYSNYYYFYLYSYHFIEKTKNEDEGLNRENFISAYLLEKQKLDQQGKETGLNGQYNGNGPGVVICIS